MRYHMAREPLAVLDDRSDSQDHTFKPRGLWYSFGASWLEWCASESPDWIYRHWYEVHLAPTARVLRVATEADVRAFTRGWRIERYAGDSFALNWPLLAMMYDAIEVEPYHWPLRYDPDLGWYNTWDCASGCIWRPSVVSLVECQRPALEEAS